jgi:Tol biopolymer transport system component
LGFGDIKFVIRQSIIALATGLFTLTTSSAGANESMALEGQPAFPSHQTTASTLAPDQSRHRSITIGESIAQSLDTAAIEALSFATLDGLFTIQPSGSARQSITAIDSESIVNNLAWSNDGQYLAVVQDYNNVYLINPANPDTPPTRVFASNCETPPDIQLSWQRNDGTLLIQQRCDSPAPDFTSNLELFLAKPSGQLTSLSTLPTQPDSDYYISPDGSRVAYVANQHIYVAEIGGSAAQQLTQNPGNYGAAGSPLVWSPDGLQLAFFEGDYPFQQINVINADGTGRRLLTPASDFQIYRSRLIWSPDSRFLAFYRPYNPPYGNQEVISLINVASGEVRAISLPGFYTDLGWSPDSLKLTVAGGITFEQQMLYLVDINTGKFTQLTPDPFHRIPASAWSPQGDWIAFTATPLGMELASPVLHVVRPDATELKALTNSNEYVFPFSWIPTP